MKARSGYLFWKLKEAQIGWMPLSCVTVTFSWATTFPEISSPEEALNWWHEIWPCSFSHAVWRPIEFCIPNKFTGSEEVLFIFSNPWPKSWHQTIEINTCVKRGSVWITIFLFIPGMAFSQLTISRNCHLFTKLLTFILHFIALVSTLSHCCFRLFLLFWSAHMSNVYWHNCLWEKVIVGLSYRCDIISWFATALA